MRDEFDFNFDENEESTKEEKIERQQVSKEAEYAGEGAKELVLICDRATPGLLEYMTDSKLYVQEIFTGLEEAEERLVTYDGKAHVVLIESGTGRFVSVLARRALVNILGMVDENIEFSVFYTDSLVYSESVKVLGAKAESIRWLSYTSTPAVVANLLSMGYTYAKGKDRNKDNRVSGNILDYRCESFCECGNSMSGVIDVVGVGRKFSSSESVKGYKEHV